MSVIPFIGDVSNGRDFYSPDGYHFAKAYPAASIQRHVGIVITGSDAPVDTRAPRPFANIAAAISRAMCDGPVMNENEAINVHDAIASYTRNAAIASQQEALTGMLMAGMKADFIVLDLKIVELAESDRVIEIFDTKVEETWIAGQLVYASSD